MISKSTTFLVAEALAADLAGKQVDPNEAQKALAYLRSKGEGKALFSYLQAVVNDGSAVIRSSRTIDYYRDLLAICQRHLRPLQGDYDQLLATFAWSLRLLRYYRAVPDAPRPDAAARQRDPRERPAIVPAQGQPQERPAPAVEAPTVPKAPEPPDVHKIFTGKVIQLDSSAAVIEVPGFAQDKVIALLAADVADLRKYSVGNLARVEVIEVKIQRSGRHLLVVKPAPKKEK